MAAVNQNADPILTEAFDGSPKSLDILAPHFALTDQRGHPVSLTSLRGHTVALTFLDPVCTSDCPLIAREFRQADQRLGRQARSGRARRDRGQSDLPIGVVHQRLRPPRVPRPPAELVLLDWLRSSAPTRVEFVRNSRQHRGAGAMVAHSDLAFVIEFRGHERDELVDDPRPSSDVPRRRSPPFY